MATTTTGQWKKYPRDKIPRKVDMDRMHGGVHANAMELCRKWISNLGISLGATSVGAIQTARNSDLSCFHFNMFAWESAHNVDMDTAIKWPTIESYALATIPILPLRVPVFIFFKNLNDVAELAFKANPANDIKVRTCMGIAIYAFSGTFSQGSQCYVFKKMA